MFDTLNITRALGDENRLRMLMALRQQALCVCQMTALLDLAPSTTSKHLSILRQARLIDSLRQGRWVYYTLAGAQASPAVQGALAWIAESLHNNPVILADEGRLQDLLQAEAALDPEGSHDHHSAELHTFDPCLAEDTVPTGASHA